MRGSRARASFATSVLLAFSAVCVFAGIAWLLARLSRDLGEKDSIVRSGVRVYWQVNALLNAADASCQASLRPGAGREADTCLDLVDSARSVLAGEKHSARGRLASSMDDLDSVASLAEKQYVAVRQGNAAIASEAASALHEAVGAFSARLARVESVVYAEEAALYAEEVARARGYSRLLVASVGLLVTLVVGFCAFLVWRKAMGARLARYEGSIAAREKFIMATKEQIDLGILAAGVAHEINNPLTAILGFTQMLRISLERAPTVAGDRVCEYARRIESQAERIAIITQNLCSLHAGPTPAQVATTDLRAIAEVAVDLVGERFETLGISIEIELAQHACRVACVDSELFHVVHSLLSNAAEAALSSESPGPPPSVKLRVRRSGGAVRLEVEDSGPGIPADVQERIFVPFFTTKGVASGARGLGLSVASNLVTRQGGRIYLDPTRRKTCFVVEFEAA